MSDHLTRPIVLRPGDGASGDDTGGAFALLEAAEPPDFGPPMHIHHDAAEAFYVLEGEYRIFIHEQTFACPAGSFIFIPAGIEHGFRVGPETSRKLNLYTPAAMVGYFDGLSVAIRDGDSGADRLEEIARSHGMEVTGPVPDGYL